MGEDLSTGSHMARAFLPFFRRFPGGGFILWTAEEGAQFIIATHSPILLGIPGAEILSFDGGEVHPCEYEETESYQVTEMFINNRDTLTERLLRDGV